MTTQTLTNARVLVALLKRGWTVDGERHGWDATCINCGWTDNFLSIQGLSEGCDDHDRQCHLPH
jgi:hypothetical protein